MHERSVNSFRDRFRWVALQIEALKLCPSPGKIRMQLRTLPRTLEETYEQILDQIPEAYRNSVLTILRWLAFAKKNLFLEQLCEVVAFASDPGAQPEYRSDETWSLDAVERFCANLITVTDVPFSTGRYHDTEYKDFLPGSASVRIVKLAHFSVKEYLTTSSSHLGFTSLGSHRLIAESCITYITQFNHLKSLTQDNLHKFRLAAYAARFWPEHAKETDESESLHRITCILFQREESFINWVRLYNADEKWDQRNFSLKRDEVGSPLYYASLLGLNSVTRFLLDEGADVNIQGGYFGSALQAASRSGHLEIVMLLLDRAADVNIQGGYYGSALPAASYSGHVEIVKLLLDGGADVNIQGGEYSSALLAASDSGHVEIVKLLLDSGADVNIQGGYYGSALQAASYSGHVEIVRLLLDSGADVNIQGGDYGSAPQVASGSGHVEIVRLLLDRGADVNIQGGHFGSALQAASDSGHVEIVKLLLNNGADVNVQGEYYGSALQVASDSGHLEIVRLLLDSGADVNVQGEYYGSA